MLIPLTVDATSGMYKVGGSFEVPYVKWGMNPSTLVLRVSDKVQITVQTVARNIQ